MNSVEFSQDGKYLVSGSGDRTLRVWSLSPPQLLFTMQHGEWVNDVCFAPSGRVVASASVNGTIKIWNIENGQMLGGVKAHPQNATSVTFSPDGFRLVSSGSEGIIRVFNMKESKVERNITAHKGLIWRIAFSTKGAYLASSGSDRVARIWRIDSPDNPISLEGHQEDVLSASFSPDDLMVATCSKDGTVRLWDREGGRQLYSFKAHESSVNFVRFSPEGQYLVTVGADNTIRLWSTVSGEMLCMVEGHQDSVSSAVFKSDGKRLASCSADGSVKIWELAEQAERPAGIAELEFERASIKITSAQVAPIAPSTRKVEREPLLVTGFEDAQVSQPRLHQILARAVNENASDIHVPSGAPIQIRRNGRLVHVNEHSYSPSEIESMLLEILTDEQRKHFKETNDLDFSYDIPGISRFRANVCRQHRGVDGTFRIISNQIPSAESLGLPQSVISLTRHHQGLVLITGPAGQGKSTTIASLIDIINSEKPHHIITVEDPIEFIYPVKKAVVNQREVGKHTKSFANALRAALREDPDVIVVGEMRDLETISLAITAAETGHLVFGSMMTTNAPQTIDRMLDSFPAGQQPQIRMMLSESLRGIISQQLLPTADGKGRVLACEVLICTLAVANMIRERKTVQLSSTMQTSRNLGMQRMDDALMDLVQAGIITSETALMYAQGVKGMETKLKPQGASDQSPSGRLRGN